MPTPRLPETAGQPAASFLQLLQQGVDFDPLYPNPRFGPLTDHLPMALTALHALGGSTAELQAFRAAYATRLVPMRARTAAELDWADDGRAPDDGRAGLGMPAAYPALLARFEAEIADTGRAAVLGRWIPRLIDALATHALHPLIRVAAALQHGVDRELAAGLAYWCSAHLDVPAPRIGRRDVGADSAAGTLFASVRAHPQGGATTLVAAGFGNRLLELAARPGFAELSGWRPLVLDLPRMAREAARVYLGTGDFFALHMVTGSHALRLVLPWVSDREAALDRWWQALAATYVVIGAPDYGPWREVGQPAGQPVGQPAGERVGMPADDVLRRTSMQALAGDDAEHVVKLLWSVREEHAAYGFAEHAHIAVRVCAGGRS